MRNFRFPLWTLLLISYVFVSGCIPMFQSTEPEVPLSQPPAVFNQAAATDPAVYILGAGDTVDIAVYRGNMSEFFLWNGDTITVSVYGHQDMTTTVKIDSSGRIMVPLIGDVQAAGKGVFEVRDEISKRLSEFFVSPSVTITFTKEQNLKVDDLSSSQKIDSSGKIILPIIGDLQADGKSIFELRDDIQSKLSKTLIDPMVTVRLSSSESHKIMVLGEVNNPSVLTFGTNISLLEALIKSGGTSDDAKLENVMLIRKGEEQAKVFSLNVKNIIGGADLSNNMQLQSGDIVYVPGTLIADVSRFFTHLSKIIGPIVSFESGAVLWPQMIDTFEGDTSNNAPVTLPAR